MSIEDEFVRPCGVTPKVKPIEMDLGLIRAILDQNRLIIEMNLEMLELIAAPKMMVDSGRIEDEIKYTSMSGK